MWRGAAPSPEGYRSLVRLGFATVFDLRAERLSAAAAAARRRGQPSGGRPAQDVVVAVSRPRTRATAHGRLTRSPRRLTTGGSRPPPPSPPG
ncbi:hypothetical protein [Streptomyces sp. BA2]|uniref:hypothetical protein n=1 Tax=Streptomyces sp. BA2 TaxID=436595 RepID=UPI003FA7AE0D